jgi:hypothetical protein
MSKAKERTLKSLRGYGYKKSSQDQVNQFWNDSLMELGLEDWLDLSVTRFWRVQLPCC